MSSSAYFLLMGMTLFMAAQGASAAEGPEAPAGLMCELLDQPELTVITDSRPEFGWIVNDSRRGATQSAWQILVASSRENAAKDAGDLWDSGKVASLQSINVEYAGKDLAPNASYFWKVKTWDAAGAASPWSQVQEFRTGNLDKARQTAPSTTNSDFSNRYPLVNTEVAPARIAKKAPGHYFIDFGKAAFGTVKVALTSPAAGGTLEVHLGEILAGADTIQRKPSGTQRYRCMTLPLKAGAQTYTVAITPDKRNTSGAAVLMPEGVGEVMPFRYCELTGVPGELDASKIRQVTVHYRFNDAASRFESSNKVLNDVWDLCKYSIKATSVLGVYIDGDRERIPYEGDAYINQLCHYGVDRDFSLARYSFEFLMGHPTWPMEWHQHTLLIAWADYMYTGNAEMLVKYYNDLGTKTLKGLAREDGLIVEDKARMTPAFRESLHFNAELRAVTDWPLAERDGYEMKPVNTVVNAFYCRTLFLMARIAETLGKKDEAKQWAQQAERAKKTFNEKLFDAASGRYIDGEGSKHSSLHANMFPLAFGLVPPEKVASVTAFIKTRGMACSVYGSQYLMDGLYGAGEGDYAFSLLTATNDRSWAHMIKVGSTISLEAWDNKFKPNQDWNHAWGAAPANVIPRLLMGIEPLEPGFARIRICPQTDGLERAAIVTPTIRGAIHLEITLPGKNAWHAKVTIPANTVAELHTPVSDPKRVTESGKPAADVPFVKFLRVEAGRAIFEIRGGSYEFEAAL
ncbi:MAG: family 78 glycoside hydrolase catalytic domain [Candidatus Sumerlaeota bacterium]|nr:family 78 glycoside hydrolase catalytic domain [Candidatus Sumerlaeota bacterium]